MTETRRPGGCARACAALLAALAQGAAPEALAQKGAERNFERIELVRHDRLLGAQLYELDSGGAGPELVLASARALGPDAFARHLTVYRWAQAPGSGLQLWRELDVPDDVVAYALGDVLGKGSAQLLYFTPSSVFALELASEAAGPVRIAEHRFFATAAAPTALPFWDGVRDLDGDGRAELVLPDTRGYAVYRHEDGALTRVSHVAAGSSYASEPLSRRLRRIRAEGRLRQVRALNPLLPAELDGDGRTDWIALDGEELLGFAQGPELDFGERPSLRRRLLLAGGRAARTRAGGAGQLRRTTLALGDVDGDGLSDLVVPDLDSEDLVTRLRLFLGSAQGLAEQPSQVLKLSSLGGEPELIDIDGDGRLDLGCATVRTDRLRNSGEGARRIDFTYYAFRFRSAERAFSGSPDLEWEVSMELAEREEPGAERRARASGAPPAEGETDARPESERLGWISMRGDFDGDGVRDLAHFAQSGELSVFAVSGAGEGRLRAAAQPLLLARERPGAQARIEDANGDGISDALLLYPSSLVLLVAPR